MFVKHFHRLCYAPANTCKMNVNDYLIDHKNGVPEKDIKHPGVVVWFHHNIYNVRGIEKPLSRVEYHQWKSIENENCRYY